MMKRKTQALAAGILPFIAAFPLPAAAKHAPVLIEFGADSVSVVLSRTGIAGFPELAAPTLVAKNDKPPKPPPPPTKPTKPTKCPPSPSKPTQKCK